MHKHHPFAMKASRSLPLVAIAVVALSCGRADAPMDAAVAAATEGIERIEKNEVITSGTPVATADLRIDGMSCMMACGSSIRKALNKVSGVASTEIVFNEGDEADHAIVTYDPTKVNDNELIQAVHGLYDGQYKVTAITITKQVKSASSNGGASAAGAEDSGVSVHLPANAWLPGLVGVLTRILRH